MKHTKLAVMVAALMSIGAAGCNDSTSPPPQTVASNNPTKPVVHGSGTGTGAHGHRKEAAGNKDGLPGGTSSKHGSGQGGGRNGGKPGEAKGNKDGHAGGTSVAHGSGDGTGRGGGHKAHSGDKNGKPGAQQAQQ